MICLVSSDLRALVLTLFSSQAPSICVSALRHSPLFLRRRRPLIIATCLLSPLESELFKTRGYVAMSLPQCLVQCRLCNTCWLIIPFASHQVSPVKESWVWIRHLNCKWQFVSGTVCLALQMTGRKGRVVSNDDGSISYESRSELDVPVEILNITEKQRFMDGDKVCFSGMLSFFPFFCGMLFSDKNTVHIVRHLG